ncbi:hypothetical protein [Nocardia inohanensis]|uniref:hypothetical protein n=1 Tax=Nocardia inohanensis TaxID=209246 RepID=UPI001FDF8947|nr:hypothetical protein [Nocardia inohanensis]
MQGDNRLPGTRRSRDSSWTVVVLRHERLLIRIQECHPRGERFAQRSFTLTRDQIRRLEQPGVRSGRLTGAGAQGQQSEIPGSPRYRIRDPSRDPTVQSSPALEQRTKVEFGHHLKAAVTGYSAVRRDDQDDLDRFGHEHIAIVSERQIGEQTPDVLPKPLQYNSVRGLVGEYETEHPTRTDQKRIRERLSLRGLIPNEQMPPPPAFREKPRQHVPLPTRHRTHRVERFHRTNPANLPVMTCCACHRATPIPCDDGRPIERRFHSVTQFPC